MKLWLKNNLLMTASFGLILLAILSWFLLPRSATSTKINTSYTVPTEQTASRAQITKKSIVWKTYKNSPFSYSIKYPQGWKLIEATKQIQPDTQFISMEYLEKGQLHRLHIIEDTEKIGAGKIQIVIYPNTDGQTLDEYANTFRIGIAGGEVEPREILDTTLGNIPGKTIKFAAFSADDASLMTTAINKQKRFSLYYADYSSVDSYIPTSIVPNEDILMEVASPDARRERNKKIYDHMLDTFTFL